MISIIVPIYNTKPYLKKCIDSIINQTYKDLEIILVDDGSTDGSSNICDEYAQKDNRIISLHQNNQGQSEARNNGLIHATGDWIGFVDSDDLIDLDFYERMIIAAESNDVDMVCCNRRLFDMSGVLKYETNNIKDAIIEIGDIEDYFYDNYFRYTFSVCNKLYRKSLISDIRFLSVKEVGSEDALFNFEVMLRLKSVAEIKGVYYNNMAREISTARNYSGGSMKKAYNLLWHLIDIADENGLSDDFCFCVYNYFIQKTWVQIRMYGNGSSIENVSAELLGESVLDKNRQVAKKMLKLKALKRMGYRFSGIAAIKVIYILKLLRFRWILCRYINWAFVVGK